MSLLILYHPVVVVGLSLASVIFLIMYGQLLSGYRRGITDRLEMGNGPYTIRRLSRFWVRVFIARLAAIFLGVFAIAFGVSLTALDAFIYDATGAFICVLGFQILFWCAGITTEWLGTNEVGDVDDCSVEDRRSTLISSSSIKA